jgi:hypothetical protein
MSLVAAVEAELCVQTNHTRVRQGSLKVCLAATRVGNEYDFAACKPTKYHMHVNCPKTSIHFPIIVSKSGLYSLEESYTLHSLFHTFCHLLS